MSHDEKSHDPENMSAAAASVPVYLEELTEQAGLCRDCVAHQTVLLLVRLLVLGAPDRAKALENLLWDVATACGTHLPVTDRRIGRPQ